MNNQIETNLLDWLLESDDIGVRYLAFRGLIKGDIKGTGRGKEAGV